MIEITVSPFHFEVSGHAEYDEQGKDIVCSAVSAIVQTTILGLQKYNKLKWHDNSDGFICAVLRTDSSVVITKDILLSTMLLGLRKIEYEYPDYIQIKEDGIGD